MNAVIYALMRFCTDLEKQLSIPPVHAQGRLILRGEIILKYSKTLLFPYLKPFKERSR